MLHGFILSLVLLNSAPKVEEGKKPIYARPELLLEPTELAKPEVAKKYVILDARGKASYKKGHIPGAVWIDSGQWARSFAKGQNRADWVKLVGALGIDTSTPVVVYDDSKNNASARMWWILRYWGVKEVRLLNGGWVGWRTASKKIEEVENNPKAGEPDLEAHSDRLATRAQLQVELKKGKGGQIVDARSNAEFCGETNTAKRNGAIPGARHLEWTDTMDAGTGEFKSAEELMKLFKDSRIDPGQPATTYCQSGGRAAVMAFALELLGGKPARNYYRSWSEWGNTPDTPVVTPQKK